MFPDEFHLQSLDKLDAALGQLQPGVAVGTVLTHLMTRLARYVADDQEVLPAMEGAKVFQKLSEAVRKASTLEATATVAELVALYHALVTFVLQVCLLTMRSTRRRGTWCEGLCRKGLGLECAWSRPCAGAESHSISPADRLLVSA